MTSISCNMRMSTLGEAKIPSSIYPPFVSEQLVPIHLDEELINSLSETDKVCSPMYFERAGARENIYFDPSKVKAAIVTCGGLCPGLNDVIRAIVMELHHGYKAPTVLGIRFGLEGFIPKYEHEILELTPSTVSDIHTFGGTILGTSRGPQSSEEIVDTLERLNINMLFVLGGDGSMKAASAIHQEVTKRDRKIAVVGIPKTIDNDINFISRSFGFETAVDAATQAIACAHSEAIGMHNGIGIVKLMGRESGFIAAHATLSLSIVNFLLIPETLFQLEGEGGFLPALETRLRQRKHAVVVVAEGAGQHLMPATNEQDSSGNIALQDVGDFLQAKIKEYFQEKNMAVGVKYIDPSYIVRAVPANAGDRVYCGFLGRYAVHAAMSGRTATVIAKVLGQYVHLPFELVTSRRRHIDIGSAYWRAALAATGQLSLKGMLPSK